MMMADSIRVVDDDFVRRIHSRNPSGHIHKGHGIVAANASIPTKYQTIVTDNSDRKGFGQKAKRFNYDANVTEAPGPGRYGGHRAFEQQSDSFSKKGTGGFASKSKRGYKQLMPSGPGPGVYMVPSAFASRKDFNTAPVTSVFHQPIAVTSNPAAATPAPNAYGVMKGFNQLMKTNNVAAASGFKSKSRRQTFDNRYSSKIPGPGHYEVNDKLQHDNPKILSSMFVSKSKQRPPGPKSNVPGPGSYKPHEPVDPAKKLIFPRKHYLCISAPAMPLPQTPPGPGPGTYEVVDYEGQPKHYMSSAAFVSTTTRWTGQVVSDEEQPGPAHYKPMAMGKQSFIYNAAGRWI